MADKIIHKRSAVKGKVPASSILSWGEIAINYADRIIYILTDENEVVPIVTSSNPEPETQIDFEVRRQLNGDNYAASGMVSFGKHSLNNTRSQINEGMWVDYEKVNTLYLGAGNKTTNVSGEANNPIPIINIANVTSRLITPSEQSTGCEFKLSPPVEGFSTFDSLTSKGTTHESIAAASVAVANSTYTVPAEYEEVTVPKGDVKILSEDLLNNDERLFGSSIQLVRDLMFVGSPDISNSSSYTEGGAITVFKKLEGTKEYSELYKIKAVPTTVGISNNQFGNNICLIGEDILAVSAQTASHVLANKFEQRGVIYLYRIESDDTLTLLNTIKPTSANIGNFGKGLSVNGDELFYSRDDHATTVSGSPIKYFNVSKFKIALETGEIISDTTILTFDYSNGADMASTISTHNNKLLITRKVNSSYSIYVYDITGTTYNIVQTITLANNNLLGKSIFLDDSGLYIYRLAGGVTNNDTISKFVEGDDGQFTFSENVTLPENRGTVYARNGEIEVIGRPTMKDSTDTYVQRGGIYVVHEEYTKQTIVKPEYEVTSASLVGNVCELIYLETFHRIIGESDLVYPDGLIQSKLTEINGIECVPDNTKPDSYYAMYDGDVDSRGLGLVYNELSIEYRALFLADSKNNLYLNEDGNVVQVSVRRKVAKAYNTSVWGNLDPTGSDLLHSNGGSSSAILMQGDNDLPIEGAYALPTSNSLNIKGYRGIFEAYHLNLEQHKLGYNNECYILVLGVVPRLNTGVYHIKHNPMGTSLVNHITDDSLAVTWDDVNAKKINTLEDCFNFSGSADGSVGKGVLGGISARPDGKLADIIYSSGQGGVIDYRLPATDVSSPEKLNLVKQSIADGTYRGLERLPRTLVDIYSGTNNTNLDKLPSVIGDTQLKLGTRIIHQTANNQGSDLIKYDEVSTLFASDASASDFFGYSVALDGTRLVVGAIGEDTKANAGGKVYIYEWNSETGEYDEVSTLFASDASANDSFGISVALDGTRLVVGAYGEDTKGSSAGKVYIYEWDEDTQTYVEVSTLFASDATTNDQFGYSVALDGTRLVVGAIGDDTEANAGGKVYIYEWNELTGVYDEVSTLFASDAQASDSFGISVALDGTRLVVGAYGEDTKGSSAGKVYIYEWNSETGEYDEVSTLFASDASASDFFGYSVALDGTRLVVGAYGEDTKANAGGKVYIYEWNELTQSYVETGTLFSSDMKIADRFGDSVALDGNKLVVGATHRAGTYSDTGKVYIYNEEVFTYERRVVAVDETTVILNTPLNIKTGDVLLYQDKADILVSGEFSLTEVSGDLFSVVNDVNLRDGWVGVYRISGQSVRKVKTLLGTKSKSGYAITDYTTLANVTKESSNKSVLNGVAGVNKVNTLNESTDTNLIGTLYHSFIGWEYGPVNLGYSETPVSGAVIISETGKLSSDVSNSPTFTVAPLSKPTIGTSSVIFLDYQINESNLANLGFHVNEITYSGSDWGIDGSIRITESGSQLYTDVNGNSNLQTVHELALPYGWVKS